MFTNNVSYKKQRIVRVIVYFGNTPTSNVSIGTGFLIGSNEVLTCCHVIVGKSLNVLKAEPLYNQLAGSNDHEKLEAYLSQSIFKLEIELLNGAKEEVAVSKFDEAHDGAILKLKNTNQKLPYFKINRRPNLELAREVFFCGFPASPGYLPAQNPFTVCAGIISTLMDTDLGQGRYEHLRINGVSLGGNSGSPVFAKNSNKVIAMVNGSIVFGPNKVPLAVLWATPLKTIKITSC